MSSIDMLDDENKMNQLNPFAVTGPGAWSNPYPFAAKGPGPLIKETPEEPSPMCLSDITAGGCAAPIGPVISCPIKRALEPTREIEPDIGTGSLDALYGNTLVPKENNPLLVPRYCDTGDGCTKKTFSIMSEMKNPWVLLFIFVLIVLAFRKSIF